MAHTLALSDVAFIEMSQVHADGQPQTCTDRRISTPPLCDMLDAGDGSKSDGVLELLKKSTS